MKINFKTKEFIYIPVRLIDTGIEGYLMLDTGADHSVIRPELINIKNREHIKLDVSINKEKAINIDFIADERVSILLDSNNLCIHNNLPLIGYLSLKDVMNQRYTIDYYNKEVSSNYLDENTTSVEMKLVDDKILVMPVTINNVVTWMIIDTGAQATTINADKLIDITKIPVELTRNTRPISMIENNNRPCLESILPVKVGGKGIATEITTVLDNISDKFINKSFMYNGKPNTIIGIIGVNTLNEWNTKIDFYTSRMIISPQPLQDRCKYLIINKNGYNSDRIKSISYVETDNDRNIIQGIGTHFAFYKGNQIVCKDEIYNTVNYIFNKEPVYTGTDNDVILIYRLDKETLSKIQPIIDKHLHNAVISKIISKIDVTQQPSSSMNWLSLKGKDSDTLLSLNNKFYDNIVKALNNERTRK